MIALKTLLFFWICDCVLQDSVPNKNGNITHPSSAASTGISKWVTPPTKGLLDVKTEFLTVPSPTEEKSAALTVAASGVISFIAILVVIVIILVSVVSLRFRCRHCKDVEGKQKPHHPMVSYSCSDAEAAVGKKNVMLVSMKDLNISNSQGAAKVTIAHEE
ncbi:endothelial cell-specific chemotaxis regulator isoform X2 [Rhineura floridana]|uniref:endothelial cell-specific chemotaxis regulator isoform X2 n=1 Tax=Rhineura floridana TaxID=261503 RepID=UPI002AC80B6F|nr:endothelial cell-specific chemotaxis regulator isoform X2 [Rhineura floridana]XP_061443311.1 endothelial cell-specific chemotaxis regulator isoform X2 [Rhineura floridana]